MTGLGTSKNSNILYQPPLLGPSTTSQVAGAADVEGCRSGDAEPCRRTCRPGTGTMCGWSCAALLAARVPAAVATSCRIGYGASEQSGGAVGGVLVTEGGRRDVLDELLGEQARRAARDEHQLGHAREVAIVEREMSQSSICSLARPSVS